MNSRIRFAMVVLASCHVSAAQAEQLFAPTAGETSVDVPEGQTRTQTDRVSVQDGAALYKTGKGEFVLSPRAVLQNNPFSLGVRQGTVRVKSDASAPDETADDAAALSVMSNAAFWVRADVSAGLVVTGGSFVAQWRDVREGTVADPAAAHTHPYALPQWDAKLSSAALYGKPPAYSAAGAGGKPAVYFGGWKSSQKMWWYHADGTEWKMTGIRNAFIVQYVDKAYGFAVMGRSGQNADFHVGNTGGNVNGPLWVSFAGDGRAMRDASRTFLNGTLVDGTVTVPPLGSNFLLDVRFLGQDANAGAFFTDRDIDNRTGGDYLSEALVFTNQLTDVQCERISRYLLRRYGLTAAPSLSYVTATGAVVACSSAQDERVGFGLGGLGALVASGFGSTVLDYRSDPFAGTVDVAGGTVGLRAAPQVLPTAGSCAQVSADNQQVVELTRGNDAAGVFGKSGSGTLRVSSVPESVKEIRVDAGELVLAAPPTERGILRQGLVAGGSATGVVSNGDFTAMLADYPTAGQVYLLATSGTTANEQYGWRGWRNADWSGANPKPEIFYVNYTYFDGGAHAKWPCGNVQPPGSQCFLSLKADASAESTFRIPERGRYCLSFRAQGRYSRAESGHSPVAVRIGPDADRLTTLCTIQTAKEDAWKTYELETGCLEAGAYVIRLEKQTTGQDDCSSFTDFALTPCATVDPDVAYRIPNGDFEWYDYGVDESKFTTNQTLRGWTFEQGTYYDTYPKADHPGIGACGNDIWLPRTCLARSAMYGANRCRLAFAENRGSYAETTFTPPAGTYLLRGDMWRVSAHWANYYDAAGGKTVQLDCRADPSVEATVTIGGVTTVLGTNTTTRQIAAPMLWQKSFAVDGTQAVTLRLANVISKGCGAIDNLVLVSAVRGVELVSDGRFETSTAWTWTANGGTSERLDLDSSFNRSNFSPDTAAGKYCTRLCQRGAVSQTLAFPGSGTYRLAFSAHSRPNGPWGNYDGNGQNPIRATLTKDAVTTEIGWTTVGCTNFIRHTMDFRVPAAGSYVLTLQGLSDGTDGHPWPVGNDRSTMLADISVKGVEGEVAASACVPEETVVSVAANARLRLDFTGTNVVGKVVLNGRRMRGFVSAATHPDYVQGPGKLFVKPKGLVLVFR